MGAYTGVHLSTSIYIHTSMYVYYQGRIQEFVQGDRAIALFIQILRCKKTVNFSKMDLRGGFAKNERGYRLTAKNNRF